MKIVVLGAGGMAGHLIALYFKEQGHDVTGFARRRVPYCKSIIGDAADTDSLKKVILKGCYDVVINCIGILNQFAEAEKPAAVLLNGYLPHFIAKAIEDTSAKLIQMSTDCVFAGNSGPYLEDSKPDGESFYDRTKSIGEIVDNHNITFRNSIIGPDPNENGIGLFNWFMRQNGTIKGYTGAIWTGVTTLTLAKAMDRAIKENLTGLYNLVNNQSISKYNLLLLFNKYFRSNGLKIEVDDKLQLDKSLRCSRTDFSFKVPDYERQIAEMKDWVYNHKDIYPHYFK